MTGNTVVLSWQILMHTFILHFSPSFSPAPLLPVLVFVLTRSEGDFSFEILKALSLLHEKTKQNKDNIFIYFHVILLILAHIRKPKQKSLRF